MDEIITTKVETLIYEIKGKQVMLDSDLAKLYQCKNGTKTINQAVKRHINRFPERFCFQLTNEEYNILQSQFGTTNALNMSRTLPYVFTEQGVAMLSSILRTEVAEQVSIKIMDAFVKMRHYIVNENHRLNNIEIINNDKFHDRFIIIDKKILYHSGASFKDIGKKCFGINKIENKELIKYILKEVENE